MRASRASGMRALASWPATPLPQSTTKARPAISIKVAGAAAASKGAAARPATTVRRVGITARPRDNRARAERRAARWGSRDIRSPVRRGTRGRAPARRDSRAGRNRRLGHRPRGYAATSGRRFRTARRTEAGLALLLQIRGENRPHRPLGRNIDRLAAANVEHARRRLAHGIAAEAIEKGVVAEH